MLLQVQFQDCITRLHTYRWIIYATWTNDHPMNWDIRISLIWLARLRRNQESLIWWIIHARAIGTPACSAARSMSPYWKLHLNLPPQALAKKSNKITLCIYSPIAFLSTFLDKLVWMKKKNANYPRNQGNFLVALDIRLIPRFGVCARNNRKSQNDGLVPYRMRYIVDTYGTVYEIYVNMNF
jgi:hypothetical protein